MPSLKRFRHASLNIHVNEARCLLLCSEPAAGLGDIEIHAMVEMVEILLLDMHMNEAGCRLLCSEPAADLQT